MKIVSILGFLAAVGGAVLLSSCGSSTTSPSGFLANYRQLGGGYDTADAVAGYIDPKIDPDKYDSIIIDPITSVLANKDVKPAVVDQLAAYLEESLRAELGKKLRIVSTPGPTTARLRVAMTDVIEGQAGGSPVTRVILNPKARLKGAVGSKTAAEFIEKVSLEGEIVDSVSGRRLLASSDQRFGVKRKVTPSTDWRAVEAIVGKAGANFRERLVEMARQYRR
jgi:hypothetical protein